MSKAKQQPTAEDWIILRCLEGWVKAAGSLKGNLTAQRSVIWLVKKLGEKAVNKMIDQLKEERQL